MAVYDKSKWKKAYIFIIDCGMHIYSRLIEVSGEIFSKTFEIIKGTSRFLKFKDSIRQKEFKKETPRILHFYQSNVKGRYITKYTYT